MFVITIDPNVFSFLGSMKDDSHVDVPPVVVIVLPFFSSFSVIASHASSA